MHGTLGLYRLSRGIRLLSLYSSELSIASSSCVRSVSTISSTNRSYYQFLRMWSAMGTATEEPCGLLTAKNNSNIGEFFEFMSFLDVRDTL